MNSDGVLNIGETLGDLKPSSDTTQEDAYRIRAQRVEEKFEHADTDHDGYISIAEFSTPLGRVVLDRDITFQTWSVMNTISKRGQVPHRPRLITLLGINGVLMSGTLLYLLIRC